MPEPPLPIRDVAIGLIIHDRRVLFVQRPHAGPLGGQWELPGGKIEPGETPEAAFRREAREETGLVFDDCWLRGTYDHTYAHIRVRLHAFQAVAPWASVVLRGPVDYRWAGIPAFERLTILPGSEALLRNVRMCGLW